MTEELQKMQSEKISEKELTNLQTHDLEVYRELQAIQDEMSVSLRGTFAKHRRFVSR